MSRVPASFVLALGVLGLLAWSRWAYRAGVARRPLLLLTMLAGVWPAALVLIEWARLYDTPRIRFGRPNWTVPAALAIGFLVSRLLRLPARLGDTRRVLLEVTTAFAACLSAYAATGLELGHALDRLTVVVALDRSRSIDLVPRATSRFETEQKLAETGMREDDQIAVVAFGAGAAVEEPPRPRSQLPSAQRVEIARDGTDIAAGIRQSLAEIPPDSAARIVLLTDGVATRGDTTQAALAATALGVPIDVIPLDQGQLTDVRVVSVRVAPRAAEGEALDLRVVTQSSDAAEVTLRVYRDGELVRSGPTRIARGEDVVFLRETATEPGLHRYDVELSALNAAQDRAPDDNAGSGFVRVRGSSSALAIESDPALSIAMRRALESAAFRVDAVGPSAIPTDLAGFARYDLIVLGDVSASDLAPAQLDALKSYVRDLGGGLLLMGGDHALGPGGYARTPIEDISPVSFDLKQDQRRGSLAEVIAVDYSGSMAMTTNGKTKLELANEAAVRSAELLGSGDRLGVMHVDTAVAWTVPLAGVADKADIAARIRRVGPGGGGIFVDLALAAGYDALRRERVELKHLLLFSDGSDAEERAHAFALVSQAKRQGITTSVVALGSGDDVPALSHMAELGGGRFYLIEDASRLPAVFAQETILAARSAINEQSFVPRAAAPSSVLRGVDLGAAPPLTGYVVTIPKSRAQVLLTGPEGDPILASWSAGVGRAGVFTSDYKDRWGRQWTSWDGAARLFAQIGRDLARRVDDPHARWEADANMGELSLRATLFDDRGRHESLRRLRAQVAGPNGFSQSIPLEATGAGSYSAKLPLSRPGTYLATLVDEDGARPLATTGAALSAGEELRPTGTDRGELRRIANLTGGKVRDTLAGIFNDRDNKRYAYDPLSELSAWAALFLLLSVAARRLSLPKMPELRGLRRARKPRESRPARPPAEAHSVFALRANKKAQQSASPTPEAPLTSGPSPAPPPVPRSTPEPHPHATAQAEPGAAASEPPERQKTAAEILLERRRNRAGR